MMTDNSMVGPVTHRNRRLVWTRQGSAVSRTGPTADRESCQGFDRGEVSVPCRRSLAARRLGDSIAQLRGTITAMLEKSVGMRVIP